jgi:hypothetical protein
MFNRFSPKKWALEKLPRTQEQVEVGIKLALKVLFWGALLAPVVILPLYYLILALVA